MGRRLAAIWRRQEVFIAALWVSRSCIPFPADPYYIKHPASSWYIVCLQMPGKSRVPSSARERFTLALESSDAVAAAHRWLSENAASLEVAPPAPLLEESKDLSFLLSDPDGNCWEIIAAAS